jgi:hypothetical protein
MQNLVAIHQPNLFPWLGFFNKMAQCDTFVLLNHTANRPNDAIYTKRVTILNGKEEYWLTIPLLKPKGVEFVPINEMKINVSDKFGSKHLKTIEAIYKKAPFYNDVVPLISAFYNHPSELISERNIDFIKEVKEQLGFRCDIHISSDYNTTEASNELLIELTKLVGGNAYLYGGMAAGSTGYQENQKFLDNGIAPIPQQFVHPVYPQFNHKDGFVKGLSIIDCLMNIGFKETASLLSSNNNSQLAK